MRKKGLLLSFMLVSVLSFTACGKKEVDYSNATENAPTEQQGPAMVADEIPEHWNYETTGALGTVKVDADITLPENYSKCTVMEFTRDDFTDEDIKPMADKIFGEGNHFLCMPYNEESLAYVRDKFTTLYATSADEQEKFAFDKVFQQFDFEAEKASQYPTEMSEENYEEYKFYQIDEWAEISGIGKIYCCEIFGTIDGKCYVLTFIKNNSNCAMKLVRWNTSRAFSISNLKEDSFEVSVEGNKCAYSMEEAEDMAKEYIEMLGYTGYDVMKSCNVRREAWNVAKLEVEVSAHGYNVYFGRKYNDYAPVFNSSMFTPYVTYDSSPSFMSVDSDFAHYDVPLQEYIRVCVDSEGICQLQVWCPMKEEGVMTENAVMLPFDSVCETAKEHLDFLSGEFDGRLEIYHIELGYDFAEEDGKIALVPTWYFFRDSDDQEERGDYVFKMNAIDGSIDSMYNESWQ